MTLVGTVWAPRGPSPIVAGARRDNGLVTVIAIHPSDADIIYVGTAGGGVWRTTDGGTTWRPIFDRQIALGIGAPGAIAIDPNNANAIYIGTSGRVTPQIQAGLFKSTDGGASCIRLGSGYPSGNIGNASQFVNQSINVIVVDPADSQTVYLSSNNGVYRSLDGGQNWTLGANSAGDARTVILDASSPAGSRVLYAGITRRGVFQSTDGGQNWTNILDGTTPAVSAAIGAAPAGFGKVVVDIGPATSPPDPTGVQVLYASLVGTGGAPDPVGLFVSTDQGATWTQQSATGMPTGTQGGYSFHMAVDPGSPGDGANDTIYVGAVGQAVSTDAGATFTGIAGLHADSHTWAFTRQPSPTPSIAYSGNDGGIFRSTDGGATWTHLNAGGLQSSLFYNLSISPDATASGTVGSLQDNGLQTTAGVAAPSWNSPQGGDGWDAAYDGMTAAQVYGTSGFWSPAPCTRAFASPDDGVTWNEITPWGTATDAGCYLASVATDASAAGTIYISGSQNLWQSQDGGATWRTIGTFGLTGFTSAIAEVARSNSNNVVVATGNQVFVSTNALAATVGLPNGVTFTDITRNLPSRTVLRVAFDPNDATTIYAVLGGFNGGPGQTGHVFRTTIGATTWTDISPNLDVPFSALALDGTDTPTAIYVGTHLGVLRSVDSGATWYVLDDIHFPRAPVTDLVFGEQSGILRAATYGRGVFEFTTPDWPVIAVNPQNGLNFGTVCDGPAYLTLQVFNVGPNDLVIHSVQRLMGSTGFSVLPFPGTPLVIRRGEEVDFTVQFVPTTPGTPEAATIRIASNDPGAPLLDLSATGLGGIASLEVAIPDAGQFGDVCVGSFIDSGLVINNSGTCPLRIRNITSSSPAFVPPGVTFYPLVVSAGGSVTVPIRFQPTSVGPASSTLTVFSNDPTGPVSVRVSGNAPAPRLVLAIPNRGDFGHVCVGSFRDEPLMLNNSGACPLRITGITSSSSEFIPPGVDTYPLIIGPGSAAEVMIRFAPTSFGPKSATLTVISDDPGSPRTVTVLGVAPSGILAVSGSTQFGGVELGLRARQTLSVCNVGECDLHVTKVGFLPLCGCEGEDDETGCCDKDDRKGHHETGKACHCDQRCSHFKILNNPFPATLRPGSCLPVTIEFRPHCQPARCCELVIASDDPNMPERILFVTGHLRHTLSSAVKCWAAGELQDILDAGKH